MNICEVTKLIVIMAGIGWVHGEIIRPTSEASGCPGMIEIAWVLGPI